MKRLLSATSRGFAFQGALNLLFAAALIAQTPSGSIAGLVRDQSGAIVPAATVTVTNTGTAVTRSIASDGAGRFHIPGLDPGVYDVEAKLEGFQTQVRQGLELTVGRDVEIELQLNPGQVSDKAVVTADAPLVETVTNTLSGLVDDKTIRELPLNGRSFDQLMSLEPGVVSYRIPLSNVSAGNSSAKFSVAGTRALSNTFLLDGTEMIGAGYLSTLPGGVLGKQMGVDAIQEFNVLLSNYGAPYGKKYGGVVNIATRSGTNQLHGSLYEFLRNSDLDTRNFFDPTHSPPGFRRNQFGASIGGPIKKDKTFFFGNYEGLRETLGLTNIAFVPDANARQGLLPCAIAPTVTCNQSTGLANVGVAPSVAPYLPIFFGAPNGPNLGGGIAEHIANPNQLSNQDYFLIRVDHNFSEKDSIFARYAYTRAAINVPDQNSLFVTDSRSRQQIATVEERHAFSPTTLNVARLGFSRGFLVSADTAVNSIEPSMFWVPSSGKMGAITFSGGVSTGNSAAAPITTSGISTADRVFGNDQFEYSDQVTKYIGRHSLQIGATVQRLRINDNDAGILYGTFGYTGLLTFLTAQPVSFVAATGDAHKSYRRTYTAAYIQDDFKVLPNLTLNLGLRYEMMTVPVEVHNRISNFHQSLVNGNLVVDTSPVIGSPYWRSNNDLFAPRVGLAWDPFGRGRTVLRSGFGIFYDQLVNEYQQYGAANPPFSSQLTVSNPSFPNAFSGPGTVPAPSLGVIDPNSRIPTNLEWNFSIQQQVSKNAVINIAYVGAHSYHLTRNYDPNTPIPQILPGGTAFYAAGLPERNPAFAASELIATDVNGSYNGIQSDLTERLSHGLRAKVSYTFSKGLDDSSGPQNNYAPGEPPETYNPNNLRGEWALSSYEQKHNFSANFTYDLPGSHLTGARGKMFGGWQAGSIVAAASGLPLTIQTGFNATRNKNRDLSDRPDLAPGASNDPVLGSPNRYFDPSAFTVPTAGYYGDLGRNTLIGPMFANVDFTLVKITTFAERIRSEFRAEFFNVLNHPNFGIPNLAVFSSTGTVLGGAGVITSTANTSRQIQFGLKLSF